jgi:hypothetical protein
VGCLGSRVSLITDHVEPIGPDAERLVIAMEAADEARVAATIAKVMDADGDMQRIELGGHPAWELIDRSHAIPQLEVETPGGAISVGAVPQAVPEPSSMALLGLGAAGVAAWRSRRKATAEVEA